MRRRCVSLFLNMLQSNQSILVPRRGLVESPLPFLASHLPGVPSSALRHISLLPCQLPTTSQGQRPLISAWAYNNANYSTSKPAAADLPNFINTRVSFEGLVTSKLVSNTSFYVLRVELDEATYKSLSKYLRDPLVKQTNGKFFRKRKSELRKVTVVGSCLSWLNEGATCKFEGVWKVHQMYGLQVEVSSVEESQPKSEGGRCMQCMGMAWCVLHGCMAERTHKCP